MSAFLTGLGIAFGIVFIPCLLWCLTAAVVIYSDNRRP